MKRIAIIAPCILPVPATKGGAVEKLITQLIDENELNYYFDVDLFTCDSADDKKIYIHTYKCTVKETGCSYIINRFTDKFFRTIGTISAKRILDRKILRVFKKRLNELDEPYHAVIVQNVMSTAVKIVDFCQSRYEFPIYFHMHNDVDIYRSPKYIQYLVRNGTQFIAVSDYIKKQILKCDDGAVVHVLYNGIDLDKYQVVTNTNSKTVTFLYAGRIIPEKGVKELVTAFNKFLDGIDVSWQNKYKLSIVGFSGIDKKYEFHIRQLAQKNRQIDLLNQISAEELLNKYNEADVIIVPSLVEEAFCMVALESMAMGKPIIATDSGAIHEVVGDAALMVNRDKNLVNSICNAIRKMALDSRLRLRLSKNASDRLRNVKSFCKTEFCDGFFGFFTEKKIKGKISVIVPVYNVADYLKDCIDSLIHQTYKDLEILLIDDGSTDDSFEICNGYADKDKRIKLITQSNQGLAAARNTGLNAASGEYIFFCDSDDYLKEDALESLLIKMNNYNADIVSCGIMKTWYDCQHGVDREELFTDLSPGVWSNKDALKQMMRFKNVCTVAWNKLYKSVLWKDERFTPGVIHEDEALIYKIIYKTKILAYTPAPLYVYRQRFGSIMKSAIEERYPFLISAMGERIDFFYQNGEIELAQYSVVSLLEQIKYFYRESKDTACKYEMARIYTELIGRHGAPYVLGIRKKMVLLAWKYFKY